MATQDRKPQAARASFTFKKPEDWIVYLREKTSPKTPDNMKPTILPSCRIEVNQPVAATDSTTDGRLSLKRVITSAWPRAEAVWTLEPSPPLAMKEEHPEDAEIIRRLQVLAEERSYEDVMLYSGMQLTSIRGVGQKFTRVAEASGRLWGVTTNSTFC
jgi:hypothetical protein